MKREYLDDDQICWTEDDGTLHVDAVRACTYFGIQPTQENQDAVIISFLAAAKTRLPGAQITIVDDASQNSG